MFRNYSEDVFCLFEKLTPSFLIHKARSPGKSFCIIAHPHFIAHTRFIAQSEPLSLYYSPGYNSELYGKPIYANKPVLWNHIGRTLVLDTTPHRIQMTFGVYFAFVYLASRRERMEP